MLLLCPGNLRHKAADEVVSLLLSQQDLGEERAAESVAAPGITRHLRRLPRQKTSHSPCSFREGEWDQELSGLFSPCRDILSNWLEFSIPLGVWGSHTTHAFL